MLDSQLLIGGTSWLSDGEGQSEDIAYQSANREKYGRRRVSIDRQTKETMLCMSYHRKKGGKNRNVLLKRSVGQQYGTPKEKRKREKNKKKVK